MGRIKIAIAKLIVQAPEILDFWKVEQWWDRGVVQEEKVRIDGWQGIQVGNDPTSV